MRVEIFSDVACPWCYIGLTRFGRVLDAFEHRDDVEVALRSFQLDPTLPERYDGTEADYLAASKGLPENRVRGMFAMVEQAAASEDLTLDFDRLQVANTWRAHRLIHAAADRDASAAWATKLALLQAHFVDGESISDPEVLRRIGIAAGLTEDQAAAAASGSALPTTEGDGLDAEIRADLELAAAYGITGVPFFVFDAKYGVSGAQPAENFAQALAQAWAERDPA
ncbi:MAG TPA: DsbA family oxidoreductase [Propioniciclava tarda]|nr:DsbA family oxidoreductase [Propioniciclava tarda]